MSLMSTESEHGKRARKASTESVISCFKEQSKRTSDSKCLDEYGPRVYFTVLFRCVISLGYYTRGMFLNSS